jgi:hypothetical protein
MLWDPRWLLPHPGMSVSPGVGDKQPHPSREEEVRWMPGHEFQACKASINGSKGSSEWGI